MILESQSHYHVKSTYFLLKIQSQNLKKKKKKELPVPLTLNKHGCSVHLYFVSYSLPNLVTTVLNKLNVQTPDDLNKVISFHVSVVSQS